MLLCATCPHRTLCTSSPSTSRCARLAWEEGRKLWSVQSGVVPFVSTGITMSRRSVKTQPKQEGGLRVHTFRNKCMCQFMCMSCPGRIGLSRIHRLQRRGCKARRHGLGFSGAQTCCLARLLCGSFVSIPFLWGPLCLEAWLSFYEYPGTMVGASHNHVPMVVPQFGTNFTFTQEHM